MKKINYQTKEIINSYLKELKYCIDRLDIKKIEEVVAVLMNAYSEGKTVFIVGNGGSAGIASHMACDLGKGTLAREYDDEEKRFRVISLTDNVPVITAYANDLSYEDIFVQQLRNLIGKGDVLVALSGSGNSANVIKAVQYAKKSGAKTVGLLGFKTGGKLGKLVDYKLIAKSNFYGPCEDMQLILDHILISCVAKIKHKLDNYRPQII